MNTDTGKIRELAPGEFPGKNEVPIGQLPKKSCNKCYGRGYMGRDASGKVVLCTCLRRKKQGDEKVQTPMGTV